MDRTSTVAVVLALAGLLTAAPERAGAQNQRPPTQGVAVPDSSVTTQSDATSIDVNPAGLGFIESTEVRYGFDVRFPEGTTAIRDEHAAYVGAGTKWIGGGMALQWLDRPIAGGSSVGYQKYSLAAAFRPLDSISTGFGLNLYGSLTNRELNRLVSLDSGLQWRPSEFFGVGVAVHDVNHPYFRGDRGLPARVEPGAALRLLGGGLVLDSQLEWIPSRRTLRAAPRIALEPLSGLRLYGRTGFPVNANARNVAGDSTPTTVGLEFSLGRVGLEAASSFRTGGGSSESFDSHAQHIWFSPRPRRSLIPPPGRWVQVDLTGPVAERAADSPFAPRAQGFLDVLTNLRDLADDPGVDGVVVRVGGGSLGYGQAWEIRRELERLESSGKTTVAFLEQPDTLEVYLASAADQVLLLPNEPYEPAGIRLTTNTYGAALAKAGIEAEFVRIGEYKSAPEAFTKSEPSKPTLEQIEAFADDLHGEFVGGVARSRELEEPRVQKAIDNIPLYPGEAVRRGFVDDVVYPDELRPYLRSSFGATTLIEEGYQPTPGPTQGWEGGPEVAVVYIDGSIIRGKSTETPLIGEVLSGSETLTNTLEDLGRDPRVRAVVVRIDSPGGSAVASDLIYRSIRRVAQVKPVVASMGDVAASGGYYVAAGADTIYATPNTLTGSIGIFAGKFNVDRLASWLGVSHTAIERGERAGRYDLYTQWTDEQKASVTRSMEYLYQLFLQQAAATRPLGPAELDERARGRIWSGEAAKKQKLVDHVGGLVDAIRRAEKLAGIPTGTAEYRTYPKAAPFIDVPFASAGALRDVVEQLRSTTGSSKKARDTALRALLERLQRSVRLPLIYDQGEALMLPPRPIQIRRE